MKRTYFILIAVIASLAVSLGQTRSVVTLEKGWKFTREDNPESRSVAYDDSDWQSVRVPHDWAIYGPFDKNNDIHRMAIVQDGQTSAIEHYGRTGGLPFTGAGWYRINFTIPEFNDNKRVTVKFDGAMSNARVYVNGNEAGYWPYGYNTFHFDITDFLNSDGKNNMLAVRLENPEESSRWYPGAGLYRNVHIITTNDSHIPVWGTHITTPVVNDEFAKVDVKTKVVTSGAGDYKLVTEILDGDANLVSSSESVLTPFDQNEFSQTLIVENPELWDIKQPNLYNAVSKLYKNGQLVDEYNTTFGIRTIDVIADKGFFLNGRLVKFQGVCLHHDLGPLGAAVNDAAIRRQIRIMQDMGVNAIRTSHNMPAPDFVRIADEMGMMIMAESFDSWRIPKVKNGYNLYFDEWAEKDIHPTEMEI